MKFADIPKLTMKELGIKETTLSVGKWKIPPSPHWSLHWHDYCTIDVITCGNAIHYTTLGNREIEKGYMHLVMPSDIHYIGSLEGCDIVSIRFSPSLITENVKALLNAQNKSVQLDEKSFTAVMGIITAMESYKDDTLLLLNLLESLLLILQNNLKKSEKPLHDNMLKVMNFLDLNFREDPSLEKTAAVGSYNPSYFSSLFKKSTGYTYTEYLNAKKIGYACAIMNNKKLSLTDIALSSGFVSLAAFNRTFKSVMGTSPKEYRLKLYN